MTQKPSEKKNTKTQNKPISINKDIWFYISKRSIEFVVWANVDNKRVVTQFKVKKSKLEPFIK